jgi:hypothetical protein
MLDKTTQYAGALIKQKNIVRKRNVHTNSDLTEKGCSHRSGILE